MKPCLSLPSSRAAPGWRRARSIGGAITFALLFGGASVLYWSTHIGGREDRGGAVYAEPLTERVSPDGAWKAYVDHVRHEDAHHVVLQAADMVFLMSMHDPSDDVLVMMMTDDNQAYGVFPEIAWTASDKLQVTVANQSFVKIVQDSYKAVHIDLRFDPDDPAARAAWLKIVPPPSEWPAVPGQ
jgi:hypothetical protein